MCFSLLKGIIFLQKAGKFVENVGIVVPLQAKILVYVFATLWK